VSIQLDHVLIPSSNRDAAARQLAGLLGVAWGASRVGPFTAVYVNHGFTIDFDQWDTAFPKGHYCFRVDDEAFDAVLQRIQAAAMAFRSTPHGPNDAKVNTALGGRIIYWGEPDGHVWEMLTASYARRP
jgi:catechol 2,3-dioxygenase-like lactoylglutathione lyase family enzyme